MFSRTTVAVVIVTKNSININSVMRQPHCSPFATPLQLPLIALSGPLLSLLTSPSHPPPPPLSPSLSFPSLSPPSPMSLSISLSFASCPPLVPSCPSVVPLCSSPSHLHFFASLSIIPLLSPSCPLFFSPSHPPFCFSLSLSLYLDTLLSLSHHHFTASQQPAHKT
jgi:hypothetical protein